MTFFSASVHRKPNKDKMKRIKVCEASFMEIQWISHKDLAAELQEAVGALGQFVSRG